MLLKGSLARRRAVTRFSIVILLLAPLVCVDVSAQIPDEFTNLKVLPKDIGKRELIDTMRSFCDALGVRCQHCHVGESQTSLEGYDFASDDKQAKRTAVVMMQMVQEINGKLLPRTGKQHVSQVRCITCHHGLPEPETLDERLMEAYGRGGVDAAITTYRELREEHYGDGAYDFSPRSLEEVADEVGRAKQDLDGALALLRLNVEIYPDEAPSYFYMSQILAVKGDRADAIANLQKAMTLDPENERYKQAMAKLNAKSESAGD